ncbi:hypothetical protein HK098_006686 [Nowakowskiella sp. JEL0407]|nr:hypothetical protein HK098_006686 [Nowakowskiella sp. JEL0407]
MDSNDFLDNSNSSFGSKSNSFSNSLNLDDLSISPFSSHEILSHSFSSSPRQTITPPAEPSPKRTSPTTTKQKVQQIVKTEFDQLAVDDRLNSSLIVKLFEQIEKNTSKSLFENKSLLRSELRALEGQTLVFADVWHYFTWKCEDWETKFDDEFSGEGLLERNEINSAEIIDSPNLNKSSKSIHLLSPADSPVSNRARSSPLIVARKTSIPTLKKSNTRSRTGTSETITESSSEDDEDVKKLSSSTGSDRAKTTVETLSRRLKECELLLTNTRAEMDFKLMESNNKVEELRASLKEKQVEVGKLTTNQKGLNDHIRKMEDEVLLLQDDLMACKQQYASLNHEYEALKESNKQLNEGSIFMEERLFETMKSAEEQANELQEILKKYETLSQKAVAAESEVTRIRMQSVVLEKENGQLRRRLQEIEERERELREMREYGDNSFRLIEQPARESLEDELKRSLGNFHHGGELDDGEISPVESLGSLRTLSLHEERMVDNLRDINSRMETDWREQEEKLMSVHNELNEIEQFQTSLKSEVNVLREHVLEVVKQTQMNEWFRAEYEQWMKNLKRNTTSFEETLREQRSLVHAKAEKMTRLKNLVTSLTAELETLKAKAQQERDEHEANETKLKKELEELRTQNEALENERKLWNGRTSEGKQHSFRTQTANFRLPSTANNPVSPETSNNSEGKNKFFDSKTRTSRTDVVFATAIFFFGYIAAYAIHGHGSGVEVPGVHRYSESLTHQASESDLYGRVEGQRYVEVRESFGQSDVYVPAISNIPGRWVESFNGTEDDERLRRPV